LSILKEFKVFVAVKAIAVSIVIIILMIDKGRRVLRYASHVAFLHVLSACAGAQNPVLALNSNASSLLPLQCNHFVTKGAEARLYTRNGFT
jgi:hypothetical protein